MAHFKQSILFVAIFVLAIDQFNCAILPNNNDENIEKKIDTEQTYYIEPSINIQEVDDSLVVTDIPQILASSDAVKDVPTLFDTHQQQQPEHINVPNAQKPVTQYTNPNVGPYYSPNQMMNFWTQYISQFKGIPVTVPVQTEYEGILYPIQMQQQPQAQMTPPPPPPMPTQTYSSYNTNTMSKSPIVDIVTVLRSVLPPNLLYFIVNWGSMIVNFFSIIMFGGLMTTAICTLTPICSITFASIPFIARNQFIGKSTNQTTPNTLERVRRASELLSTALEKYEQLQKTYQPSSDSSKN